MSRRVLWVGYIRNILFRYPHVSEAEREAVDAAMSTATPETQKIIRLVFFKRTHTLDGAALVMGYSYRQAQRLQWSVYRGIADRLGLP